MFLQKTGTRFKQLISQKSGTFEEARKGSTEESPTEQTFSPTSTSSHRRDSSWLSQSSVFSAVNRHDNIVAALDSPQCSAANRTSRSSESSLCSCDCGTHQDSVEHACDSLSDRPKSSSDAHIIPPLSPMKLFGDAETWRLIFQENANASRTTAPTANVDGSMVVRGHSPASSGSRADIEAIMDQPLAEVEALLYNVVDDDNGKAEDVELEHLSNNVEQLIRETDAAFQAVGSALADAKAVTNDWNAARDDPQQPRRSSLTKSTTRKAVGAPPPPIRSPIVIPTSNTVVPPALKSPALKSPISLKSPTSRKKHEKKKLVLLDKTAKKLSPSIKSPTTREHHPRWTLTEMTANMAEVFSGKLFKQDVEEMLTPERLEQIKKDMGKDKYRSSEESAHSSDDGIPTKDGVQLEEIGSPKPSLLPSPDLLPPVVPPQVPPKSKEQIQQAKPVRAEDEETEEIAAEEDKDAEGLAIKGMSFPCPPRVSTPKPSPTKLSPTFLPTIPEVSPFAMTPQPTFGTWTKSPDMPSSEFIDLPSTTFSLVSPFPFQNGPIRISRSEPTHDSVAEEDALDWTAFQVAIAGTLDDTDIWETEEDEMDDLLDWWAGFDMGIGGMVQAPRRKKMKVEIGINADEIRNSRDAEKGRSARRSIQLTPPSKERRRPRDLRSSQFQPRKSSLEFRGGQWQFEYHKDKYVLVWQENLVDPSRHSRNLSMSSDSLPPSPMIDFGEMLNMEKEGGAAELPVVPMGFNLGHDLGDFLNWETYHVNNLQVDECGMGA